ncbi:dATP/dGTP pyrophosphohydrolase domain-containing protein [Acidithiobacillus sp.]
MTNQKTDDFLTLDKLRAEVEPILNHICIVFDSDIGRLVGVAEDDRDFYYVVDRIRGGRTLYSAVGPVVSLKGAIPEDRYASMDGIHTVNGCPAVERMVVLDIQEASEVAEDPWTVADTILARKILRNLGYATEPKSACTSAADSMEPGADERVDRIAKILADAKAEANLQTQSFDLVAHLHRQRDFSLRTFGPGDCAARLLDHIRKELLEIEASPTDITEWVDVVMMALDGAWRAGYMPEAVAQAIADKQGVNEARQWPDWQKSDPDKAMEHVRQRTDEG